VLTKIGSSRDRRYRHNKGNTTESKGYACQHRFNV
jgi:hypothetical protein